jgi:transketolase
VVDCSEDEILELERRARTIRKHVLIMINEAGSGHPGGSLSYADIMTALYFKVLDHRPSEPQWEDRDRLVLSKGHAAPVLYAALAESGYFPVDELKTLRKLGSRLQGHPSRSKTPGVEMSTGSLGQGLSVANGMALAAKLDGRRTRIFCLCGDGEMESGQVWEAAMLASHFRLDNVTAFVDKNGLQIDGSTEKVMCSDPLEEKWRAFGWNVISINGHNMMEIITACERARQVRGKPTMIIATTVKGKGVSFMEGSLEFHGKAPDAEQLQKALEELEVSE